MFGFVLASLFFERARSESGPGEGKPDKLRLPVLAAWLPYLLLLTTFNRLPMESPSIVFGVGFLLSLVLLVLDRWSPAGPLSLVAVGSATLLQITWLATSLDASSPWTTIFWTLAFTGLFIAYPFAFPEAMQGRRLSWWTSALAGPLHFGILAIVFTQSFDLSSPGLLPASFAALYGLLLYLLVRGDDSEAGFHKARLALFGGVTLFFVSLIFPFQFEREWLTMGWALEGLTLIALFHRISHAGLKKWGIGLLLIAFVRLEPWPTDRPEDGILALSEWISVYIRFGSSLSLTGGTTLET